MTKKKNEKPLCPLDYAFKRIGGKYKARTLFHIHEENNVLRYSEIKRILRNITSKMMTQTLRELEQDELISRKVYPQVPPRVEYSLTETGKELIPFITHIAEWGKAQMKKKSLNE